MKNTLENKAKFFGQYATQKICRYTDWPESGYHIANGAQENEHLELTPLSQITDEDAIEVAKICDFIIGHGMRIIRDDEKWVMYSVYNDTPYETVTLFFHFLQLDIFSRDEAGNVYQYDTERILMIIDYLRSHGYVLPWLDTTVEQQIEYGWIKLKQIQP